MSKKWYTSKTIWVNGILLVASVAQAKLGINLSAETQGIILTMVNLALRAVTKAPLNWK